jgi:hypothetical protein
MAAIGSQRGLDSVRRNASDPFLYTRTGRPLESTLSRIRTRDQSGKKIYTQAEAVHTDKDYLRRKMWERYSRTTLARSEGPGVSGRWYSTKRYLHEAPDDMTRQHHGNDGWSNASWLLKFPAHPMDTSDELGRLGRTHSALTMGPVDRATAIMNRTVTPHP